MSCCLTDKKASVWMDKSLVPHVKARSSRFYYKDQEAEGREGGLLKANMKPMKQRGRECKSAPTASCTAQ